MKKKGKKQRDKHKEYSKLILSIRTAIIKHWKNKIDAKLRNIKSSRKIKIKVPDYEIFNEKSKNQKVISEFNMKMRDILYLHLKSKKKPNTNPENIKKLETMYLDTHSEALKQILDLINMTYREVVKLFFDNINSKEFRDLTRKEKNNIINKNYSDRYGDSLLEKEGFFRYFESKAKISQ